MSDQVFTRPAVQAFVGLLRGHSALTRRLSGRLLADHGLTLNDYEVLLHLARAPDRRLRRVDLVERLLLTPSGITRLLDGLERCGYVAKAACDSDARVTYAVLTEDGLTKIREASKTHLGDIDAALARFDDEELETLSSLLGRLTEADANESCEPD
ncbi:MAG: MarR family transcriptional regulator [Gaiellaceae bacterium]